MQQQLILQFQTNSIEDYDAIIEFEDRLIKLLEPQNMVDGHDVDSKRMNIFILTHNAFATFEKIRNSDLLLSNSLITKAVYRLVGSDKYHILWPSNLGNFRI